MVCFVASRPHRGRIAYPFFAIAATLAALPAPAQTLGLADALRSAQRQAPALLAQDAAIRAAREASIGAAELPDPKLVVGVDNLPADGPDRFSVGRDFMTMRKIGVMQDFPRERKRELRGERAAAEVRKETAVLAATRANLKRDVALAWIEAWLGERQGELLRESAREAELAVATVQAAFASGQAPASEAFAARQAAVQVADRAIEARRLAVRSRALLARWVGAAADAPLADPPDFTRLAHDHEALLGDLDNHPHLAMYLPMQEMAQAELGLAEAARLPDWSVELAYAQRGPAYSNMLSIGVRIDLPIFEGRRQVPAIASKAAALEKVRAEAEDARRAHLAEIRAWLADWHAALERAKRIESDQEPLARERVEAALAAYRGGKGPIAPVLDARRNDVDTRLAHLQAIGEAARAWAQLNFALPDPSAREPS